MLSTATREGSRTTFLKYPDGTGGGYVGYLTLLPICVPARHSIPDRSPSPEPGPLRSGDARLVGDGSANTVALVSRDIASRIMRDAPVVVVVLDLDGRVQYINPFFEQSTGYRLGDVQGMPWFETFLPARDRERIRTLFSESSRGRHVTRHVNAIVTRTGEERQIEWTDAFVHDDQGEPSGILAVGQDVTNELAVGVRYGSVVAAMHDGVVVQAANGEIVDCNAAAERMLGLSADQMAGRTSMDPRWRSVREDGTPFRGEDHPGAVTLRTGLPVRDVVMGVHHPGGNLVWLLINAVPFLRAGDGAVMGNVASFSDITARKRAEEALLVSNRLVRKAQETAHLGTFVFDPGTQVVEGSDELFRIFGIGREDFAFSNFSDAVHPDDRKRVIGTIQATIENEDRYDIVHRLLAPGGTEKTVRAIGEVARNADGAVILIGTVQDISERTRAEAALHATERRLSLVLDNVTDGFFTLDRDWRYTYINRAGASMVGKAPEELLGRVYQEAFPEAVGTIWERTYRHVMETGTPEMAAEYFEPLDRWFEATVSPLANGVAVFFRDISVAERAKRALSQERERLHEAQRIAKLGSWELDLVTNSLTWSDEVFRIFEIDAARFAASYEAFLALTHPDDRAAVNAAYQESVANRGSYEIVHRLLMSDNRVKWVQERGRTHYDAAGRALRSVGTVQDVTEQMAAKEEVRNQAARLREAQRVGQMGSLDWNLTTNELIVSDETARIFGFDRALGNPTAEALMSRMHPDDRERVGKSLSDARSGIATHNLEHRVVRPDGEQIHVRATAELFRDGSGIPVRMLGTVLDITARKNAADAVRRSDGLLRTVIAGAPVVIFALDRQGVFRFSEGRALEKLGVLPGQMVGASALDVYGGIPGFEEVFRRALSGEQATLVSNVGSIAFEAAYAPSFDADGAIDGVIGVGFDITDRLAAEAGLREREMRLSAVFNHTSDAMLLLSVNGNRTLRVVAANRAFVDRVGRLKKVDEADLVGLTFEELTLGVYERPPAVLAEYLESLRRVIDARAPLMFEHSALFGATRYFAEVSLVPVLDGAGACVQVLWISHDITARKEADAQLRTALHEKETLLREIHHRVKNNLQVIAGLVHFQGKKLRAPEDVAAFTDLRQRIFAMALLHERLYLSPNVARIAFGDYVRALVAELSRSSAPRRGIRIDVTVDDVRLPIELAMPSGMIVSELVTNVLKYAFPGTREGIATVSVRAVGNRIVLGVDDDGVGFPDGFDPGAGGAFGWELVRTLVMQLDGTVTATTDRGAHVSVSFAAPPVVEGLDA